MANDQQQDASAAAPEPQTVTLPEAAYWRLDALSTSAALAHQRAAAAAREAELARQAVVQANAEQVSVLAELATAHGFAWQGTVIGLHRATRSITLTRATVETQQS